ncbi:MerR family transcriptional regulator [Tetragenococcus koreensis]|uniref:MerR family transcriptional regulator n=1 Tax=Tetragenococcus koreensis TaxID=290335 RepID=UPI000F4FB0EF|nr:MerR family transcriptional regulator [Tetragenococcus koreensis]AYW46382.1 MerR family transcriptional regulator [Tetragenococcus koreensis]GEN92005.1 MerR family transcriptional regulator [Tetragenococcus koreensis]
MNYSIGEISKKINLSIDTLRFYEKEGLIVPTRNSSNRRVYDEKDITWIEFLKRLKMTGMKISDMREYATLRYQGDETASLRLSLLQKRYDELLVELEQTQKSLNFLKAKIDIYRTMTEE